MFESVLSEEWNSGGIFQGPALPDDPYVEIKRTWSVGEGCDDLSLDRDSVFIDLTIKCVAQGDDVLVRLLDGVAVLPVEPELHAIKEMKARPIYKPRSVGVLFISEEDRRPEYSFEAFEDTAIVRAVFGKPKEIQKLCGRIEMNCTTSLFESQSGYPDGDQTVLPVWQSGPRMRCDLEKETTVSSAVNGLAVRRLSQGNAAKHKRPCVIGQLLLVLIPLLTDEVNSFEFFERPRGNANARKYGSYGDETVRLQRTCLRRFRCALG
jgi:hypothetical protein